jgi:hypothetical protein
LFLLKTTTQTNKHHKQVQGKAQSRTVFLTNKQTNDMSPLGFWTNTFAASPATPAVFIHRLSGTYAAIHGFCFTSHTHNMVCPHSHTYIMHMQFFLSFVLFCIEDAHCLRAVKRALAGASARVNVRASLAIHTLTHDKQGQQTNEQTAQNAFQ